MMVTPEVMARLQAFKRDLFRMFPGSIEDIILFGSRARGDAHPDSDYDVAVVLRGTLADDRDVRRRVSDVAWDHQCDGIVIQAVPLNADTVHRALSELAMRIAAEGISVR